MFYLISSISEIEAMKSVILRDGVRLAYQEWGASTSTAGKKLLNLHGWLDNSNSFSYLGPKLADLGYHCIALDHIGHGWSGHLSSCSASYGGPKYVSSVHQFVEQLGWEKLDIVAHSMGTGVGLLYAGAFPEKVKKLVMIDGFGPVTYPAERSAKALRKSIEAEDVTHRKRATFTGPKLYKNFEAALAARIKSVSTYPGTQFLSTEAARALVARQVQAFIIQPHVSCSCLLFYIR